MKLFSLRKGSPLFSPSWLGAIGIRTVLVIGMLEKVSFPDLRLRHVPARIDTGAFTSSLHCFRIKETVNGLRVKFLDLEHPQYTKTGSLFRNFSRARVLSTSGHLEERYKIKTRMKVGNKIYKTEFTLTNRSHMRYPILLGRKALQKRFIVDVSKKYLLSPPKK